MSVVLYSLFLFIPRLKLKWYHGLFWCEWNVVVPLGLACTQTLLNKSPAVFIFLRALDDTDHWTTGSVAGDA